MTDNDAEFLRGLLSTRPRSRFYAQHDERFNRIADRLERSSNQSPKPIVRKQYRYRKERIMEDSADELVREIQPLLADIAQMLDEMKTERAKGSGLPWSEWCEERRQLLSNYLRRAQFLTSGKAAPAHP